MPIQGLRTTTDIIAQFQDRPENWRLGYLLSNPNGTAPLYALTSMMKAKVVDDPVYHWFEEELPTYRLKLSAAITAAATTIPVISGALSLTVGDKIHVENEVAGIHEIMLVTADPTVDTSVIVARGAFGSTAAAVDPAVVGTNPWLLYMGSAFEEGSDAPEARTFNGVARLNYCEIQRTTFSITNTANVTTYRTGDAYKNDVRRNMQRHAIGLERAFLLGKASIGTRNGRPFRTTGGILTALPTTGIFNPPDGIWTMEDLEELFRVLFIFGSSEKMMLCGNRVASALQQIARRNSDFNLASTGQKEYGMNIMRFTSPHGVLVVKTHPLFNQLSSNVNPATPAENWYGMDAWAFILDMDNIEYVHMKGRDTRLERGLQLPGTDGFKDGHASECGLRLAHLNTHAVIKGLYKGALDAV